MASARWQVRTAYSAAVGISGHIRGVYGEYYTEEDDGVGENQTSVIDVGVLGNSVGGDHKYMYVQKQQDATQDRWPHCSCLYIIYTVVYAHPDCRISLNYKGWSTYRH